MASAPLRHQGLQNLLLEGPDGSRVLSSIAGGYGMAGGLISSMEQLPSGCPAIGR